MKTKTAIIITALMILAIALLNECGTVGSGSSREENIAYPLDGNVWQVGHSVGNRSERITEFVLRGEKIDNWTGLARLHDAANLVFPKTDRAFADRSGCRFLSEECPILPKISPLL